MNKEKFEKDMAAFSFGQIQDFATFYKTLKLYGYTISDIESYIEAKRNEIIPNVMPKRNVMIKCPECGAPMMVLPVNDKPSTQTGDDSKSVLVCSNKECMNTVFSVMTCAQLIKELSKT